MKKLALMSSLVDAALAGGGAIVAQELGAYVPASVDGDIVDGAKILIGAVAPAFLKGKMQGAAKAVGAGFAAQGALNLYNKYMKDGYVRIGYPINSPGLAGGNSPGYPIQSSGFAGTTRRGVAGGAC